MNIDELRYPTGKWIRQPSLDAGGYAALIQEIAATPARLAASVKGLTDAQLDTPYREGGWTPRQIVHHIADSHMNAYIRFKLGMTEDNPTIKPYDEKKWSETIDAGKAPADLSLAIVDGVHQR
jgi:DinB family protein